MAGAQEVDRVQVGKAPVAKAPGEVSAQAGGMAPEVVRVQVAAMAQVAEALGSRVQEETSARETARAPLGMAQAVARELEVGTAQAVARGPEMATAQAVARTREGAKARGVGRAPKAMVIVGNL